jgi:hypothetical protein
MTANLLARPAASAGVHGSQVNGRGPVAPSRCYQVECTRVKLDNAIGTGSCELDQLRMRSIGRDNVRRGHQTKYGRQQPRQEQHGFRGKGTNSKVLSADVAKARTRASTQIVSFAVVLQRTRSASISRALLRPHWHHILHRPPAPRASPCGCT